MRLISVSAFLFFVAAVLLFAFSNRTPVESSPVQILGIHHCQSQPCLFGTPIAESSRNQIERMIDTSPLTGDVTFNSSRRLNWRWSQETAQNLNMDAMSESNWSYIALSDRGAEEVRLSLKMRLSELMMVFGMPDSAIPYMATQRGELHYLLTFRNVPGFFEVALTCASTDLTPNTPVVAYLSKNVPNVERLAVVNWHVYTTTLPNCSIFR